MHAVNGNIERHKARLCRTFSNKGSELWGDICSSCWIHFYQDYYFTCFNDGDYIRWMYKPHSSVVWLRNMKCTESNLRALWYMGRSPMVTGCRDSLRLTSNGVSRLDQLDQWRRSTRYEISLMDEDHGYHDQSSATEIVGSSSSEGATTTAKKLNVECQRELPLSSRCRILARCTWD